MSRAIQFEVHAKAGEARRGTLRTPHGDVPTPAFMPVGTYGTVKGLTPVDIRETGASIVLSNALHLWVRPGDDLIRDLGGLHKFMGWDGPILTDSGGFQVWSLREYSKVKEDGVRFRAPIDGAYRTLTPEVSIQIQENLGVDLAMAFDECIEWPADRRRVTNSTARTTRWLKRMLAARTQPDRTAVLGIVQGGFYADLRRDHARVLADMDLDAYAIGGLSVGEPREQLLDMVATTAPELPEDRVRYLMGVGYPVDILDAVHRGVDLFDCVLPTRTARFGTLFTSRGRLQIKHAKNRRDDRPVDALCTCYTCRTFSRAYLRHLFVSNEVLAPRLLSLHNVAFYQGLMARTREAISAGPDAFSALRAEADRWMSPIDD